MRSYSIRWSKAACFVCVFLLHHVASVKAQPEATRATQEQIDTLKRAELAKQGITIRAPRYFPRDWRWTKEQWTGDDKPYIALRLKVDRLRKQAKNQDDEQKLVANFKSQAQKQPRSPSAQFAWAYAAIPSLRPGSPVTRDLGREITVALAAPSSPRAYQYARARYLVLMNWGTWSPMKTLGLRLSKRNPNDYAVKANLVRLLALGTVTERRQAVTLGQQLVRSQPKRISAHGGLGDAYKEIFYRERNINAGYKAIAAFRKALTLKPSSRKREDLAYLIGIIEKDIPNYRRRSG